MDSVRMDAFAEILRLAGADPGQGWTTRVDHFALFARSHPSVAAAVIRLLERENRKMFSEGGTDSEEFSNYYGDLIGHVAALKDPAAVGALMGAITTGLGATDGLAALGETALPSVLAACRSPDIETRQAALTTLATMLKTTDTPLSASRRGDIRSAFIAALDDEYSGVRISAIDGLAAFPDPEVIRAVRRVSQKDPFRLRSGRYQVRERAVVWLRRFAGDSPQ